VNKNVTMCPTGYDVCYNSAMKSKVLSTKQIDFKIKGCGHSNFTAMICPAWKAEAAKEG